MSSRSVQPLESRVHLSTTPNDPDYDEQYGLDAVNMPAAWDVTTGSTKVTVAHIDTGVDYTHPDLYLNVWINQDEIPAKIRRKLVDTDRDKLITFYDLNAPANKGRVPDNNRNGYIDAGDILRGARRHGWMDGVDEGENGYKDDLVGWDFAENDNDPMDSDGHGTHTAGTIAAIGNNGEGGAGVVWRTRLMALKIFDDGYDGDAASDPTIAKAIRYSAANGARVSNNSWGGEGYSGSLYNAIKYAAGKGQVFVTSAGNDHKDLDSRYSSDYPAQYDLDNIVVVAATTSSRRLASYSDYGQEEVDLAAPGSRVLSTVLDGEYDTMSGTSMASPHVAGAAALILSVNPKMGVAKVKARLIAGADQNDNLVATSVSNGELNCANALANAAGDRVDQDPPDDGDPFPWMPKHPFSTRSIDPVFN
jgi:subtilisin family serine protease